MCVAVARLLPVLPIVTAVFVSHAVNDAPSASTVALAAPARTTADCVRAATATANSLTLDVDWVAKMSTVVAVAAAPPIEIMVISWIRYLNPGTAGSNVAPALTLAVVVRTRATCAAVC